MNEPNGGHTGYCGGLRGSTGRSSLGLIVAPAVSDERIPPGLLQNERTMIRTSALLTAAILLVASELPGDVTKGRSFHINVPRPGANPIHHIWVPDSVSYFRAIIIRHHGCGTDGFGTSGFYDYQWRYLAERQHCIMVLPEEKSDGGCDEWYNPDNGSYAAMMKAIDSVAGATNHPELRTAPFALWGTLEVLTGLCR